MYRHRHTKRNQSVYRHRHTKRRLIGVRLPTHKILCTVTDTHRTLPSIQYHRDIEDIELSNPNPQLTNLCSSEWVAVKIMKMRTKISTFKIFINYEIINQKHQLQRINSNLVKSILKSTKWSHLVETQGLPFANAWVPTISLL